MGQEDGKQAKDKGLKQQTKCQNTHTVAVAITKGALASKVDFLMSSKQPTTVCLDEENGRAQR